MEAAGAEKLNVNSYVSSDDVTYNRSIISLSRYGSSVSPYLYSAKWIIFPMPFCVEKEENVSSHTFYLVYDKENTAMMIILWYYVYAILLLKMPIKKRL